MEIPNSLMNKIKRGKCVLFLGAGASISSGGPSGKDLAEYIRDNVVFDDRDFDEDLAIYVESTLDRVSRKEIELSVKRRVESLKPSKGYKQLSSIPWKAIYSTNYDTLIEDAYKSENLYRLVKITQYNQFDTLAQHEVPFYKIHGCITDVFNPERPLIISFSDLVRNRESKKELLQKLMNDLIETILFVGYSFKDQVITDLLSELQSSPFWESISEKYAVLLETSNTDKVKFRTYGISVIEASFDSFFEKVSNAYNADILAKLEVLRKNLSINLGKNILEFEPKIKDLLDTYFDYYTPGIDYPNDPSYFYRGGKPNWGNIINNLDVPRDLTFYDCISKKMDKGSLDKLIEIIEIKAFSENPNFTRIKLKGPAAVGKTTLVYRLCYELVKKGVLALIYKDVGDIRKGLLAEIYKINNYMPFVVVVDVAASVGLQISQMYTEAVEKGIPIIFLLATRESDWHIYLDGHLKTRLGAFEYIVSLEDKLELHQSKILVDNLFRTNVIVETPEKTSKDLIKTFQESNHLMVSLMESIENTKFDLAISSEYDSLSELGRNAYGLISLVSRYGLPFKWEILQRTLNKLFNTDWHDFITKVVQAEGKDVIREEGTDPNYFYSCRHSVIADKIALMHFGDVKEDELSALQSIILSINKGTSEEIFAGRFLQLVVNSRKHYNYSFDEILTLLNAGITSLSDPSFLLHIKGQYLLDHNLPEDALACFEKNLKDESRNRMYSLHSAGMSHFAIARMQPVGSGRRQIEIKKAKDYLYQGLMDYKDNVFFHKSLLQVLNLKVSDGNKSESDLKLAQTVITLAEQNLDDKDEIYELLELFKDIAEHE